MSHLTICNLNNIKTFAVRNFDFGNPPIKTEKSTKVSLKLFDKDLKMYLLDCKDQVWICARESGKPRDYFNKNLQR